MTANAFPSMRQSFTWWSFAKSEPHSADLLEEAAAIGYEAVELLPVDLWTRAKDAGLTISAMNGHASIEAGLNRLDHHGRILSEIEHNIRLAERWNVPNLICFSGNRGGLSQDEGALVTIEGLRRAAPLAEAAGVTLVLELLNSKVDHPDYQCDSSAWGLRVIRDVDSPNVKLLYDVYHAQVMEGNLIETIRASAQHIGHVHTAGVPGRHELDDAQEIHYPAVLRALHDTGYRGFVAHEFVPRGNAAAALRAAFELTRASVG